MYSAQRKRGVGLEEGRRVGRVQTPLRSEASASLPGRDEQAVGRRDANAFAGGGPPLSADRRAAISSTDCVTPMQPLRCGSRVMMPMNHASRERNGTAYPEVLSLLRAAVEREASDVHLVPGYPPTFRVHGRLEPVGGDVLDPDRLRDMIESILPERALACPSGRLPACVSPRMSIALSRSNTAARRAGFVRTCFSPGSSGTPACGTFPTRFPPSSGWVSRRSWRSGWSPTPTAW